MFTGIIDRMGRVVAMKRGTLTVETGYDDLAKGESVAVNGVCLTVVKTSPAVFNVVKETLKRSNLGTLRTGDRVNLERALRPIDRLSGHFVQGHVDGTGILRKNGTELRVEVAPEVASQMVAKGSVAVDGISLTIVEVGRDFFTCAIIPTTRRLTTLGKRRPGDGVNIEIDMLSKFVRKSSRITPELLKRAGYIN